MQLVELLRPTGAVGAGETTHLDGGAVGGEGGDLAAGLAQARHRAVHQLGAVLLQLDGEEVVRCAPVIGYLHRAKEKVGEAVGNDDLKNEGKADNLIGSAKEKLADAGDAIKDKTNEVAAKIEDKREENEAQ